MPASDEAMCTRTGLAIGDSNASFRAAESSPCAAGAMRPLPCSSCAHCDERLEPDTADESIESCRWLLDLVLRCSRAVDLVDVLRDDITLDVTDDALGNIERLRCVRCRPVDGELGRRLLMENRSSAPHLHPVRRIQTTTRMRVRRAKVPAATTLAMTTPGTSPG